MTQNPTLGGLKRPPRLTVESEDGDNVNSLTKFTQSGAFQVGDFFRINEKGFEFLPGSHRNISYNIQRHHENLRSMRNTQQQQAESQPHQQQQQAHTQHHAGILASSESETKDRHESSTSPAPTAVSSGDANLTNNSVVAGVNRNENTSNTGNDPSTQPLSTSGRQPWYKWTDPPSSSSLSTSTLIPIQHQISAPPNSSATTTTTTTTTNTNTASSSSQPLSSLPLASDCSAPSATPAPTDPPSQMSKPPPPPPFRVQSLDELETLGVLGQGAGGVVYKVMHRPTYRILALKVIPIQMSEEAALQLLLEIRTLHDSARESAQSQSSVVEFYGAFYKERTIRVLLEYMDEGSLSSVLQRTAVIHHAQVAARAQALASISPHITYPPPTPLDTPVNRQSSTTSASSSASQTSHPPSTPTHTPSTSRPHSLSVSSPQQVIPPPQPLPTTSLPSLATASSSSSSSSSTSASTASTPSSKLSLLELPALPYPGLPESALAGITYQLLRGLDYLHRECKTVHRDIKPSNVLINRHGQAKLADFGVSGQLLSTIDTKRTFVGTVSYMCPQRIQGHSYGTSSDIWSLGITLFECAVGDFPYLWDEDNNANADAVMDPSNPLPSPMPNSSSSSSSSNRRRRRVGFWDVLERIVKDKVPSLPSPPFTPAFRSLISLCLKRDPNERPSAAQLLSHPFVLKHIQHDVFSPRPIATVPSTPSTGPLSSPSSATGSSLPFPASSTATPIASTTPLSSSSSSCSTNTHVDTPSTASTAFSTVLPTSSSISSSAVTSSKPVSKNSRLPNTQPFNRGGGGGGVALHSFPGYVTTLNVNITSTSSNATPGHGTSNDDRVQWVMLPGSTEWANETMQCELWEQAHKDMLNKSNSITTNHNNINGTPVVEGQSTSNSSNNTSTTGLELSVPSVPSVPSSAYSPLNIIMFPPNSASSPSGSSSGMTLPTSLPSVRVATTPTEAPHIQTASTPSSSLNVPVSSSTHPSGDPGFGALPSSSSSLPSSTTTLSSTVSSSKYRLGARRPRVVAVSRVQGWLQTMHVVANGMPHLFKQNTARGKSGQGVNAEGGGNRKGKLLGQGGRVSAINVISEDDEAGEEDRQDGEMGTHESTEGEDSRISDEPSLLGPISIMGEWLGGEGGQGSRADDGRSSADQRISAVTFHGNEAWAALEVGRSVMTGSRKMVQGENEKEQNSTTRKDVEEEKAGNEDGEGDEKRGILGKRRWLVLEEDDSHTNSYSGGSDGSIGKSRPSKRSRTVRFESPRDPPMRPPWTLPQVDENNAEGDGILAGLNVVEVARVRVGEGEDDRDGQSIGGAVGDQEEAMGEEDEGEDEEQEGIFEIEDVDVGGISWDQYQ